MWGHRNEKFVGEGRYIYNTYCASFDMKKLEDVPAIYLRHVVVLHRHGDDVDTDHAGYRNVKVLAADDRVQPEAELAVVRPIGRRQQLCQST